MGRNRGNKPGNRDYVWDAYYGPMAKGAGGFNGNGTRDTKTLIRNMYRRHLSELAVNRFKWEGLPKSVNPRFLELELFRHGLAVFYKDKNVGAHLAVAAAPVGALNVYQDPVEYRTYGTRYISQSLKANECVPIWSNMLRTPDTDVVEVFADELAELTTTIQANSRLMRKPRMIYANENTRLSYQNLSRQLDEGVSVIYGQEGALDPSNVQVLDLGGDPVSILNLQIVKSKTWNEAMTILGINNANQDKKERLVADEVDANNDQVFASRGIALNERKRAAELINEKFRMLDGSPLNVTVDFNTDSQPQATDPMGDTTTLGITETGAGR